MVGFAVSAQAETPKANPAAEKLAREAHQVRAEHCADTASDDMTVAAESVAVVSDVWARVSAELEASKKVYLLYWRGVLAQCLNQNERALIDLKKFIVERQNSTLWPDLVDDSRKRVKRLERKAEGPPRVSPGWFLGGGLAAGSAIAGVGAAVAWQQSQDTANEIYPNGMPGEALDTLFSNGEDQAEISAVLTAVAVGCGVGSLVSFVLTATQSQAPRSAQLVPPLLLPTGTGVTLTWEGRW